MTVRFVEVRCASERQHGLPHGSDRVLLLHQFLPLLHHRNRKSIVLHLLILISLCCFPFLLLLGWAVLLFAFAQRVDFCQITVVSEIKQFRIVLLQVLVEFRIPLLQSLQLVLVFVKLVRTASLRSVVITLRSTIFLVARPCGILPIQFLSLRPLAFPDLLRNILLQGLTVRVCNVKPTRKEVVHVHLRKRIRLP